MTEQLQFTSLPPGLLGPLLLTLEALPSTWAPCAPECLGSPSWLLHPSSCYTH